MSLENGRFRTKNVIKIDPQKKLWLDIYVEKRVWAKKSAKLVIPVCSTFQNDLHPPIGGHHPVLYFTTQIKKKYCTAMCYLSFLPHVSATSAVIKIQHNSFLKTQDLNIIQSIATYY